MAEPYVFLGSMPSLVLACVYTLRTAQHPGAQRPRDAEKVPVAGLRAASPPRTGGTETEGCWEPLCYWSWESKGNI